MIRRDMEPADRGSAIITVMVTMTVLVVLASVALTSAIATMKQADRSGDWNHALSAAEAGVADYLARLNRDDNYWMGTQKTGSTRTGIDCGNVAMRKPPPYYAGQNCGWTSNTPVGWLPVPGSDDGEFHYDVDITSTPTDGTITLTSTGRVNASTRTVQVRLRRGGFGEFLYYTVYETTDTTGMSETEAARCTKYRWQGRDPDDCTDIYFVSGDNINGPLHTNDSPVMRGTPRFRGTTTTSMPTCRVQAGRTWKASDCYALRFYSATPRFDRGIAYRAEVTLPDSIGNLKRYVDPAIADRTVTPTLGCRYTGPTRIKLLMSGGVPSMQVWSKYTLAADLNPGCGTAGTTSGRLGHSGGQVVPIPQNNLVLVQAVPSNRSSPSTSVCKTDGGIGDGLPLANDINLASMSCRNGDVYVQGSLKGRLTIAADNNVVVTNNLTYAGGETGTDALGLISSNSVVVYHPVRCTATTDKGVCTAWANHTGTLSSVNINAAILTLQHSFTVQSHDKGAKLGSLRVFGSIAQRFRGPVGTGDGTSGTGYLKDYNYDTRLRYAPPPYFLDPVKAGWGQKTYGEVLPRYR